MKEEDEMLEEYDFSDGIRGKYVSQYNDGINIIKLGVCRVNLIELKISAFSRVFSLFFH